MTSLLFWILHFSGLVTKTLHSPDKILGALRDTHGPVWVIHLHLEKSKGFLTIRQQRSTQGRSLRASSVKGHKKENKKQVTLHLYFYFLPFSIEHGNKGNPLTPVHDLILVAPVDGLDELVDVAADFIGRCSVGQFLQKLQHVLQTPTRGIHLSTELKRLCSFSSVSAASVCCRIWMFLNNSERGDSSRRSERLFF